MNKIFTCNTMLCFIGFAAQAQDFAATNPKLKVPGDTLKTRLLLVTVPPGATTTVHSHPSQIIYSVHGGTMLVEYEDGKKRCYINYTTVCPRSSKLRHKTTNIGKATLEFIVVEISRYVNWFILNQ